MQGFRVRAKGVHYILGEGSVLKPVLGSLMAPYTRSAANAPPPLEQDGGTLLTPLVERLSDLFRNEILRAHTSYSDRRVFAYVSQACRKSVQLSGLPWAGDTPGVKMILAEFVGSVDRLKFAREEGCPWNALTCAAIAKGGDLKVLKYARANGCPWDSQTCAAAALAGNVRMMRYARTHGCPWDERTCAAAGSGGHLPMLKFLRENGCPWDNTTLHNACARGHLKLAKWAVDNGLTVNDGRTVNATAKNGHLQVLKWIFARGLGRFASYPAYACAALNGHLEIMKWMYAAGVSTGGEYDDCTSTWAAEKGYIDVLKWTKEHIADFPWSDETCLGAAKFGQLEALKYLKANKCPWHEDLCNQAAERGHVDVLKWARAHDPPCPLGPDPRMICWFAAKRGHLDVLKWARAQDPPIPFHIDTMAAQILQVKPEMREWLYLNDCPWGTGACTATARIGDLPTLQWLRARGCPWDPYTDIEAIRNGKITLLTWVLNNGCDSDNGTGTDLSCCAAEYGQIAILDLLRRMDHGFGMETYYAARRGGQVEVMTWLRENGCPAPALIVTPLRDDVIELTQD